MKIFATPMIIEADNASDNFRLELLNLQSDVELKEAFKSKSLLDFWSRIPEGKHHNLIDNTLKNVSIYAKNCSAK